MFIFSHSPLHKILLGYSVSWVDATTESSRYFSMKNKLANSVLSAERKFNHSRLFLQKFFSFVNNYWSLASFPLTRFTFFPIHFEKRQYVLLSYTFLHTYLTYIYIQYYTYIYIYIFTYKFDIISNFFYRNKIWIAFI